MSVNIVFVNNCLGLLSLEEAVAQLCSSRALGRAYVIGHHQADVNPQPQFHHGV